MNQLYTTYSQHRYNNSTRLPTLPSPLPFSTTPAGKVVNANRPGTSLREAFVRPTLEREHEPVHQEGSQEAEAASHSKVCSQTTPFQRRFEEIDRHPSSTTSAWLWNRRSSPAKEEVAGRADERWVCYAKGGCQHAVWSREDPAAKGRTVGL